MNTIAEHPDFETRRIPRLEPGEYPELRIVREVNDVGPNTGRAFYEVVFALPDGDLRRWTWFDTPGFYNYGAISCQEFHRIAWRAAGDMDIVGAVLSATVFERVASSGKAARFAKWRVAGRRARPAACGHDDCSVSTGYFGDELTFGRGGLDDYGYWDIPCAPCARRHEQEHPEDGACWPHRPKPKAVP